MQVKFPELSKIEHEFKKPDLVKAKVKEISEISDKVIRKIQEPKLFRKLKERLIEIWKL
jgi:hypothetical protein